MRRSTSRIRFVSTIALVGAAALGLAACSGTTSTDSGSGAGTGAATSAASGSAGAGVLPPVIVTIADLDGTTVTVPLGNTVDLVTAKDSDVTAWSATISDDTVAEFVPGKTDGGA